jgi:hypothetical protein
MNIHALIESSSICLLMRHAEREAILSGTYGNEVNLTQAGIKSCIDWAQQFGNLTRKIYTSPVRRCLQTANVIAENASIKKIHYSLLLGDPGVFVVDRALAQNYFLASSVYSIVQQLLMPGQNPQGFCPTTQDGVKQLLNFMLSETTEVGLNIFITHDSILAVVLGYFFPDIPLEKLWPNYLEGAFFYSRDNNSLEIIYRDKSREVSWV